jgi:prephenate dehydrogenase
MNVEEHDRILAATSHLPHMLAYALVNHLAKQSDSDVFFELAAGGFYDFTRIASSDPVMWRDICLHNRCEIAKDIRSLSKDLELMAQKIEDGDGAALKLLFEQAKHTRSRVADYRLRRIETVKE